MGDFTVSAAESPELRPTLADVARAAGVSMATASRVLNGFPRVSAERRKQVESAMLALGYARQRAATSRQTGSIALVVCEEVLRLFTDPCFPRIAAGVGRELAAVVYRATTRPWFADLPFCRRGGHAMLADCVVSADVFDERSGDKAPAVASRD